MHHPDEGDVVDFVGDVLQTGDGGLVLAGEVGELRAADVAPGDLIDRRGTVDDLVGGDTGDRGAQHNPRAVAAGFGGGQPDGFELFPDRRHVLDPDPVILDVLPVGDVSGVAGVKPGDLADHSQLLGAQRATVDAHPHHEVRVVEFLGLQRAGAAAVDTGSALGVKPPPAKPAAQISRIDRIEASVSVDRLDPVPDVEPIVVFLGALVGVERLEMAQSPLALPTAGLRRWRLAMLVRTSGASVEGAPTHRGGHDQVITQPSFRRTRRRLDRVGRGVSSSSGTARWKPGHNRHGGEPPAGVRARPRAPECHLGAVTTSYVRMLGYCSRGCPSRRCSGSA